MRLPTNCPLCGAEEVLWTLDEKKNERLFLNAEKLLTELEAIADVKNRRCTSCGCEIAPEGYCGCLPDEGDLVTYERRCSARRTILSVLEVTE